jgi:hypothetical protein
MAAWIVDEHALVVGLQALDGQAEPGADLAQVRVDLGERGATVDGGLAHPEQVEVGAV